MKTKSFPEIESLRLKALSRYDIFGTGQEDTFDRITRIVADFLKVPIVHLSLVGDDHIWIKSCQGTNGQKISRKLALWSEAIHHDDVIAISDLRKHADYASHSWVKNTPGYRFYAAAPIRTRDHFNIGVLSINNTVARKLDEAGKRFLADMAQIAMDQIELRRLHRQSTQETDHFTLSDDERLEILIQERAEELMRAMVVGDVASRSKTDFLANMSHELRTPLNAIIGFSDLVRSETFGPLGNEVYKDYLGIINESGSHLLSVITELLELSRIETGGTIMLDEAPIDVAKTVMQLAKMILARAQDFQIDVNTNVGISLPDLYADPIRLKQILLNLLDNALKFTGRGGQITFSAGVDDRRQIYFSIADTGIGISSENIDVVSKPFSQVARVVVRPHEGSGIGLPLSKSLVELHGGTLHIDSELGSGTTVTLFFPASRTLPGP